MTARRARLLTAVVVAASFLSIGTAQAAGTARITTPSVGATLTSPTPITIEVVGDNGTVFEPRDHEVLVRLADHTGAMPYAGTRIVAATCRTDCHTASTWTVASFDPATLAPFAAGPSCNGGYTVQARVDGGPWTGNPVRIARAPGAPRDVSVTAGVREATVQWHAPADPDVVGYTVDRRRDGGTWQQVADVAPGTRSLTDEGVAAGQVAYRVVTLRGDGLTGGQPAAPCTDDDPDLATPSAPVTTTVRAPATAPSSPGPGDGPTAPSGPSPSGTPSDGGDGGTTTPDGGSTDGGAAEEEAPTDGEEGSDAPTRDAGSRVAPPSRLDTVTAPDVDVPGTPAADDPQVAAEEERYYGEGQGYSEELDFGDVQAPDDPGDVRDPDDLGQVDALGEGPATTRVLRVPGALQAVLGEELALDRVLAPAAAGMILLAFGLHLRRWTREGVEQP